MGPLRSASLGRWTAKCTITSKKAGGKIFLSLHKMGGMSHFSFSTTSFLRVLLHSYLKKFPSSKIASYTSLGTKPLKPAGMILWRRT
jgi:hypothetical protein